MKLFALVEAKGLDVRQLSRFSSPVHNVVRAWESGHRVNCAANTEKLQMTGVNNRLFVALDLPEPVRARFRQLADWLGGGRAVPADQLHLTIRFIGPAPEAAIATLKSELEKIRLPVVELAADPPVLFPPGGRKPSGIWLPMRELAGTTLKELRRQVEKAALFSGLEPDSRPLNPHVTLRRFGRTGPPRGFEKGLNQAGYLTSDIFCCHSFSLYSSRLTPEGSVYTCLERFPLA